MSVIRVSFIVFPCLRHLAPYLPVLHFRVILIILPTNLLYKFCTSRVLPPQRDSHSESKANHHIISYVLMAGEKGEDPPAGPSHAASSAGPRRRGSLYEDISRDHRAVGEAPKKNKGGIPNPNQNPTPVQFRCNTKQNEEKWKTTVTGNL